MSRWLATILAILGGAIAAAAVTITVVVGAYSLLWLFVFGDSEWPAWVRPGLDLSIPVLGLLLWALFAHWIWRALRPQPA